MALDRANTTESACLLKSVGGKGWGDAGVQGVGHEQGFRLVSLQHRVAGLPGNVDSTRRMTAGR